MTNCTRKGDIKTTDEIPSITCLMGFVTTHQTLHGAKPQRVETIHLIAAKDSEHQHAEAYEAPKSPLSE